MVIDLDREHDAMTQPTREGGNKIDGPYINKAHCVRCPDRVWTVFLPDGCEDRTKLECPKCHNMTGQTPTHSLDWNPEEELRGLI